MNITTAGLDRGSAGYNQRVGINDQHDNTLPAPTTPNTGDSSWSVEKVVLILFSPLILLFLFIFGDNSTNNEVPKLENDQNAAPTSIQAPIGANADPLEKAILEGDIAEIKRVATKQKINKMNELKQTPLMFAIQSAVKGSKLEIVQAMVDCGARITPKDSEGSDAVHYAAMSGDVKVLRYLLKKRPALLNSVDNYGQTPIILAATYGNLSATLLLVKKGADTNVVSEGQNLLHIIAAKDWEEIPSTATTYGKTETHSSQISKKKTKQVARWNRLSQSLIDNGIDPNALNSDGKTPYQVAKKNGYDYAILSR